jgi:regulator of protease activity HflC (stomatin/prohibitin superfamily)
MIIGSVGASIALAAAGVAVFVLVVTFFKSSLKVVQQGCVGVVKRFGEFKTIYQPGLHILMPLADRMDKVDIR